MRPRSGWNTLAESSQSRSCCGRRTQSKGTLLASALADGRIAQLAVCADANEDELLQLGQRFGIISPVTSRIVPDTLEPYVYNNVPAPGFVAGPAPEMGRYQGGADKEGSAEARRSVECIACIWQSRVDWWKNEYIVPTDYKWQQRNIILIRTPARSNKHMGLWGIYQYTAKRASTPSPHGQDYYSVLSLHQGMGPEMPQPEDAQGGGQSGPLQGIL